MADRIYVTVTNETDTLYEIDYPLDWVAVAISEFARVQKVAERIVVDAQLAGEAPVFRAVMLSINHELPSVLYWETTGAGFINGRRND